MERTVDIRLGRISLKGDLTVPDGAKGLVIFAHGSGSSRRSPRNRMVAATLNEIGIATLLFDLLSFHEAEVDNVTAELRFNIPFLASRLVEVTKQIVEVPDIAGLPIGYFGASTGAAAALIAARELSSTVVAVVSRGGRPDLAHDALREVKARTLLLVGGHDHDVIYLNQMAYDKLRCEKELKLIKGATHLFEEPGALEQVASFAATWFFKTFTSDAPYFRHRAEGAAPELSH